MVSRAEVRPTAAFWPIMLRDRLPVIPIPLRLPDEAVRVDLQEALDGAYDRAQYEHIIYLGSPEPALSAEDAAWARQFVPAQCVRSCRLDRSSDPSHRPSQFPRIRSISPLDRSMNDVETVDQTEHHSIEWTRVDDSSGMGYGAGAGG